MWISRILVVECSSPTGSEMSAPSSAAWQQECPSWTLPPDAYLRMDTIKDSHTRHQHSQSGCVCQLPKLVVIMIITDKKT